jgi:hypothetical protein
VLAARWWWCRWKRRGGTSWWKCNSKYLVVVAVGLVYDRHHLQRGTAVQALSSLGTRVKGEQINGTKLYSLRNVELTQSAASVTFDNIPQTGYTDLKVVMSARQSTDGCIRNVLYANLMEQQQIYPVGFYTE